MKLKRIFAAVCAAVCAAVMAGCNVEFGTNPNAAPDDIVAKPTRLCFTGEMDITFEEFNKEYLFYLNSAGVVEDETNAELCRQFRESIIDNLIYDKVLLMKAKEYGIDTFTEDERKEVQEEFESEINDQILALGEEADYSDLPDGTEITEEMKRERGEREFNRILESCGMTRDEIYGWIESYMLSQKVLMKYIEDYDRTEAEKLVNEYIEDIKSIYEKSPEEYEQGDYSAFWAPEGSRRIKHVLLGFDDETLEAIQNYREEGDDEAADALRAEKAAEFAEKQAEVEKAIDDGEEWDDILLKYSADAVGSSFYPDGYLVIPNGTSFVKEFQEAAFVPEKIGDRTTCVTDYGLHIMIYAKDGEVTEEEVNDIIEYMHYNIATDAFSDQMDQWVLEYGFEKDNKALRLDA